MRTVPPWSDYFMSIAETVSTRSKDSDTAVGCVVVDTDNHIIGTGYNGFPKNCIERPDMWKRPEKYKWVVHAELNALLHCVKSTAGATLYTTLYPCKECAKSIAAASISKVWVKYATLNGKDYKDLVSESIFKHYNIEVCSSTAGSGGVSEK